MKKLLVVIILMLTGCNYADKLAKEIEADKEAKGLFDAKLIGYAYGSGIYEFEHKGKKYLYTYRGTITLIDKETK